MGLYRSACDNTHMKWWPSFTPAFAVLSVTLLFSVATQAHALTLSRDLMRGYSGADVSCSSAAPQEHRLLHPSRDYRLLRVCHAGGRRGVPADERHPAARRCGARKPALRSMHWLRRQPPALPQVPPLQTHEPPSSTPSSRNSRLSNKSSPPAAVRQDQSTPARISLLALSPSDRKATTSLHSSGFSSRKTSSYLIPPPATSAVSPERQCRSFNLRTTSSLRGAPATTGYGAVGPSTRALFNSLIGTPSPAPTTITSPSQTSAATSTTNSATTSNSTATTTPLIPAPILGGSGGGGGGGGGGGTPVPPPAPTDDGGSPAPTLTFTSSATSVAAGGNATITWSTTNASSCTASGGWSGAKATSGSQSFTNLSVNQTYTLQCSGAG